MAIRRRFITTMIAAALLAMALPLIASAQGNYDPWGRDRRDRDNRYSNDVRELARRLDNRSGDFQRHLDSALDRSRIDNTRREDDINQLAAEFRNTASRFRSRVGNGRDNYRGSEEAQRLVNIGARIDRVIYRLRVDPRTSSDWSQISQDLRQVASIYRLRVDNRGYGRDDVYGNPRNDPRNNNDWWRRIPFPN